MITRRDIIVAMIAIAATLAVAATTGKTNVLGSTTFDWNALEAKQTNVGSIRQLVKQPTATLQELEMHITTLNAGQTSHSPHRHPNEEVVIIKEGTVEAFINGEWKRLGPGSVIFNASNDLHGIRNVGDGPATYHVVNWISTETPKAPAQESK